MRRLWHDPPVPDQSRVSDDAITKLLARARRDVDEGRLPSCQLALAHGGRLLLDETIGAPPDSRYSVFSVTKAYVAAGVWLLLGEGALRAETRVVDLVPEFGTNGKDVVTLEHLLTHTAGFARAPLRPEEGATRDGRLARFAAWRLDWQPGTRTEYHTSSAHWVVAELIERVTGVDFRAFLAERLASPLGLPGLTLGAAGPAVGPVLDVCTVGASEDSEYGTAELSAPILLRFNEPVVRAAGVPGAGAVARAADIALFYQALVHNEPRLWDPATLADGTGTIRNRYVDPMRGVAANRTLGLAVAGDDGQAVVRDFGSATGPRAFGAAGVGGQIAWADPDSGLSFCWLTNGLDADLVAGFKRSARLSTLAARCIGAL